MSPWTDGVAGRFVASHRQQQEEHVEVHVRQRVAVDLGLEEPADDVVLGLIAMPLGELLRVHEHLDLSVHHLFVADLVLGILRADHAVAPVEDLVPVIAGHTDQLGDHLERQLGGHVDHEVGVALGDGLVEDVAGQLADVRLEHADHAGSEAAVDELAVPGVLGRVHHQHEVAGCLGHLVPGHVLDHHDATGLGCR